MTLKILQKSIIFLETQQILLKKRLNIIRPIPYRFLQMHTTSSRFLDLWNCWVMYYSAFISKTGRKEIQRHDKWHFHKHQLPQSDREEIKTILQSQRNHSKTGASNDREESIILSLFNNQDRIQLITTLYQGITEQFLTLVKKYQNNKPLMHELHEDMLRLIKDFFSGFILPEKIPAWSKSKQLALKLKMRAFT